MKNLEKIPQLVEEGKMTRDQASLQIMETVYKNKAWFGLKKLKSDQLHDFMLFYYDKSRTILDNYDKEKGSFANFLYANVNNHFLVWGRLIHKKEVDEQTFEPVKDIVYEESLESYAKISQPRIPEVHEIGKDEIKYIQNILHNKEYEEKPYTMNRRSRRLTEQKKNEQEIQKRTCLVLLLKSCAFVDDKLIEKVSTFCQMSYDEIKSLVDQARDSLKAKKGRFIKIEQARDNYFYFKRKYFAEMMDGDYNTEFCSIINQKIVKMDKAWKDKNTILHSQSLMVPTNIAIGRILGLSDKQVRLILNMVPKNIDENQLSQYYRGYEDIFGKRKSEQETRNVGTFSGTYSSDSQGRGNNIRS